VDKQEFEVEADRLVRGAAANGIVLRVLGALAFHRRCPRHSYLQERLKRAYTDIDFGAYGKQARTIQAFLAAQGYVEDEMVYIESQGSRLVLNHPETGLHLDVFLDRLDFNHPIAWNGRLEIDGWTIPLAEMLLQKMQIVQINEKDLIDTIMLLLEHPLTEDEQGVNIALVARLCAKEWGWWRTLTMNLGKVRQAASAYDLSPDEQHRLERQVDAALARIEAEPKSMGWKVRARVGDRKKWYQDVGELAEDVGEA
jgi:hypothetical protein